MTSTQELVARCGLWIALDPENKRLDYRRLPWQARTLTRLLARELGLMTGTNDPPGVLRGLSDKGIKFFGLQTKADS